MISLPVSARKCAAAATIAVGALGTVSLAAPAAHALTGHYVWAWEGYTWSDPNALAECDAFAAQLQASDPQDLYRCAYDPSDPVGTIRLRIGVYIPPGE